MRARIGSEAGAPVVSDNRVLIGTNNVNPRLTHDQGDQAVLMCFSATTGDFHWQIAHPRLNQRAHDLPTLALMCRPQVERNKVYYQNNRGELLCRPLDSISGLPRPPDIWRVDMIGQLGVFKRDACDIGNPTPSPLVVENRVYCVTGNGTTFGYSKQYAGLPLVPKSDAPSFLAVDKENGQVVWSSSLPGKRLMYGQWGSPALCFGKRKDGNTLPSRRWAPILL